MTTPSVDDPQNAASSAAAKASAVRSGVGGVSSSDTRLIRFTITARTALYGDSRSFIEWRIQMWLGERIVGVENGPRRAHVNRGEALRSARARVRELRSHDLYIIEVKQKHIRDGTGRSCSECALSQALGHNQERMGFSREYGDFGIEVDTYGAWRDPRGVVVGNRNGQREFHLPADKLPGVVCHYRRDGQPRHYTEDMVAWSRGFDDWADVYGRSQDPKSLSEYRRVNGFDEREYPAKPCPCSFVFDRDALEPVKA